MREFSVLLALAALALLVAPSHPMVYGAGAVVAVLAIQAVHTPRPGIGERAIRGKGGSVVAPTKDARARSPKLPLRAGFFVFRERILSRRKAPEGDYHTCPPPLEGTQRAAQRGSFSKEEDSDGTAK